MTSFAKQYKELNQELYNILEYWSTEAIDEDTNLFFGEIDHYGTKNPDANRGIIMYSRIMWTFSSAARFYKDSEYLQTANKAKSYIETYFFDKENGGYFWELDSEGKIVLNKKQVYAQAFVIYAYSEYYLATGDKKALETAMNLFNIMESKCYDSIHGGYFEAYSNTWDRLADVRLSSRDLNLPKGMNTNLHVLEAYTCLYEATKDAKVGNALRNLIDIYSTKIIDKNNHIIIFFKEDWTPQTTEVSFGHDIESSWILWEAAEALHDKKLLEKIKPQVLGMVDTFLAEGFDKKTSSSYYEFLKETNHTDKDRHWWVQVEAMEGLANAYNITGDEEYRKTVFKIWEYVQNNIIDKVHGEWFWRIDDDGFPVDSEPKIGMWKCPYHNSRSLMRIIQKIEAWNQ